MIGDPHAQAVLLGQRQYPAIGGFVEPAFAGRADGGEAGVGDLRHAGVVEHGQRWRAPERQDERADRGGLADGRTNDAAGEDEQERERDEKPRSGRRRGPRWTSPHPDPLPVERGTCHRRGARRKRSVHHAAGGAVVGERLVAAVGGGRAGEGGCAPLSAIMLIDTVLESRKSGSCAAHTAVTQSR